MKKRLLAVLLSFSLLFPFSAFAADQGDLMQRIDALSKELDRLRTQMGEMQHKDEVKEQRITAAEKKAEAAAEPSAFTIGGDYRAKVDSLHGTTASLPQAIVTVPGPPVNCPFGVCAPSVLFGVNSSGKHVANDNVLTNRFGLNMQAKATEDVTFKARLLMYKVWGEESESPVAAGSQPGGNAFFADKFFNFDGNIAHIPKDNTLRVDQAYATWSNVFGAPLWFSLGRRPSTGGVPLNIRQNTEKIGNAGIPGMFIDYAFDGGTIGFAPDIDALPGAYAKFCFGKGFDSGFRVGSTGNGGGLRDVWFIGINAVPYDSDVFHAEFQYSRAFKIFAFPESDNFTVSTPGGALSIPNANVGDIWNAGGAFMGKIQNLGLGDLNLFLSPAMSRTLPNSNSMDLSAFGAGPYGLMWDFRHPRQNHTGYAAYLGGRYDIKKTGTKIGAEYNYGTKYWITFAPAGDDLWTGKLGTRGSVYETYLIQELNKKPIAKRGNAFFRLGYQYYDFKYTGSNNWIGAPEKIANIASTNTPQFFSPLKHASDIYLTFEVIF